MLLPLLRHRRLFRPHLTRVSAALLACFTVGATLAWAAVHIRLESSVPAAGAVVSTVPERFELRFSGSVNEALSSLVLVGPTGDSVRVTLGALLDDERIVVGDVPELTAGKYLVLWKIVSADGHPVAGEFEFTLAAGSAPIGSGETRPPAVLAESVTAAAVESEGNEAVTVGIAGERPPAGTVLLAGLGLVCLLGFGGLLWYCGSLPLLREPRIGGVALALGWAALVLLSASFIGWTIRVVPPGAGLAGVTAAATSSTGIAALVRLALVATALVALPRHGRAAAALALAAVLVGAMSGHSVAIAPWITMPAKAIHLGSVSVWFGGLLLLALAPDGPTDGSGDWQLRSVVHAVSASALLSVLLVAASGVVQSATFVGDVSAYTGTIYGRGVLMKWAGLLALMGFGAYHRFRAIPVLEGDGSGQGLRRTVRLETAVMLAVIMVAAWLARVSPPAGH